MFWFLVDSPPWDITINLSSLLFGFEMVTTEDGDSFELHVGPLRIVYDRPRLLTPEETADLREIEGVLQAHYRTKRATEQKP